jgi:SOS-response transcriptional repressor LexA
MIGLTPKQRELLTFIREYTEEHGLPPSVTEMSVATKACRSLVARRLDSLCSKKKIRRQEGKTRSITVLAG